MEKNGRTLRKDMAIICRGIREFGCILPGQMGHVCRRSLLAAGIPFVATAVSAHIMDGPGQKGLAHAVSGRHRAAVPGLHVEEL